MQDKLYTVTEIAAMLGARRHQIAYIIRAEGMEPTKRFGMANAYDDDQMQTIREHLIAAPAGKDDQ